MQPKIILLLETSRHLGREMLRGAADWSKMYGPVTLAASAGHFEQSLPEFRKETNFGVIARLSIPGLVRAYKKYRFPLIALEPVTQELLDIKEELGIPEIRCDAKEVAAVGVDYLWNNGFRNFAFCGFPNLLWSQRRETAFAELIQQRGGKFSVYPADTKLPPGNEQTKLKHWLKGLLKPVALLACDDDRAHQILQICGKMNIQVPQDISVLGIGNDDILCELATPPLSSVDVDLFSAGFNAVRSIAEFIRGTAQSIEDIPMKPLGVASRFSTDFPAVNDPVVTKALLFIHQNYRRPIGVGDIVRYLDVSRRTLELKFQKTVKQTVADRIEHSRMERAKRLLTTGDVPVSAVADAAGFCNFRSMLYAFHTIEGCTPTEYRKKHTVSHTAR